MPNQVSRPHQHTMVSSKISKVSLGFPGKVNAFAFNRCNKCVWNEQKQLAGYSFLSTIV